MKGKDATVPFLPEHVEHPALSQLISMPVTLGAVDKLRPENGLCDNIKPLHQFNTFTRINAHSVRNKKNTHLSDLLPLPLPLQSPMLLL